MDKEETTMTDIHIYGKLRDFAENLAHDKTGVVRITPESHETVQSLLERLGLPVARVHTIFFNHKVLAARTKMALWIGHRQVRDTPFDWNLDIPVKPGDRIGLFGRDMSALVV